MAAVATAAGACSDSAEGPEAAPAITAAPSTTTEPVTTTSAPTAEEAVMADYLAGWDAVIAAAATRNPEEPALLDLYRGRALANTQAYVRSLIDRSVTTRGKITHDARVVSVAGDEAVVHDCTLDEYVEYDAAGIPLPQEPGRDGRDNRLRLEGGRWRTYDIIDFEGACA